MRCLENLESLVAMRRRDLNIARGTLSAHWMRGELKWAAWNGSILFS